jgi:hypothetical protein
MYATLRNVPASVFGCHCPGKKKVAAGVLPKQGVPTVFAI